MGMGGGGGGGRGEGGRGGATLAGRATDTRGEKLGMQMGNANRSTEGKQTPKTNKQVRATAEAQRADDNKRIGAWVRSKICRQHARTHTRGCNKRDESALKLRSGAAE